MGAYGEVFIRSFNQWAFAIGQRPLPPPPGKTDMLKGWMGAIRRECDDHIIVLGERYQVLLWTRTRRHHAPFRELDTFFACPILGGWHHQYVRI